MVENAREELKIIARKLIRFLEDEYAQVRNQRTISSEVSDKVLAELRKAEEEQGRIIEEYPNVATDDELEELDNRASYLIDDFIDRIPIRGGKRKTRKRKIHKRKARKTKQRR